MQLHGQLTSLGELDNTYVIYTSDHGYHLGQFGIVKGKSFPFETDIKVPFFVRGPGFEGGSVRSEPVLNIDLAPTMLDVGGVERPAHMDGRSILDILDRCVKLGGTILGERPEQWPTALYVGEIAIIPRSGKSTQFERGECRNGPFNVRERPCYENYGERASERTNEEGRLAARVFQLS